MVESTSGRSHSHSSSALSGQQDWHSLGEVLYRKWNLYDMAGWKEHKVKLEDYSRVCGAQYGGPVALIRESPDAGKAGSSSTKVVVEMPWVEGGTAAGASGTGAGGAQPPAAPAPEVPPPKLFIYTSSGLKISECDWLFPGKVVGLGWGDQEQLVVVMDDATVLTFDIKCKLVRQFQLFDRPPQPAAAPSVSVLEVQFWGNGLVAMCSDQQGYVAEGLASPDQTQVPRRYKLNTSLSPDRPYTAMAIIPPLLSRSGLLELVLGTPDNSAVVVDENEVEDQGLQDRISAPIVKIAVQPNGRYLACYRKDGVLTVLSSNFATKVLDFNTKSISRPLDMCWCGEDAVVLLWRNTGVVMVGPFGDWLNFPYSGGGGVLLVAESDSVRILTGAGCDMVQRVPASTEAIRRIGSTDPAALMYDAMEAFEEGDPKSDENIRSIAAGNSLGDAISACVSAAAAEFDISRQQAYLKAASYGKAFSPDTDPSEFVDTAKRLRVLNDIRRPAVGIPLTIQQYNRLTPEVLVSRLTQRDLHLLALKVCELLGIRNERVLVHWASEKVRRLSPTPASDEEIADTVRRRLDGYGRVSFLEIAASAFHMGRRRLATLILDMEQHAADQVPLLLSMQEDELALQKAINSEDTDLIYLVLIHLERSRPDIEHFFRLTNLHPEASNLLKQYYRNKQDHSLLNKLLAFNKQHLEAGISLVNPALAPPPPTSSSTSAAAAAATGPSEAQRMALMRDASTLFGQDRSLAFLKTSTDEQIELMETLKTLEIRVGCSLANMSLSEVLTKLVELGVDLPADGALWEREMLRIAKKFKASDKMVWFIKIAVYSRRQQWGLLSQLANSAKSPVGYKPFAAAALKHHQPPSEVEKYIDKCTSQEEKFDLFVEIAAWRKAFDCAKALRDPARTTEVLARCRDAALERQCQELLAKL